MTKSLNFAIELLNQPEKEWLNTYHEWCGEKLSADLEGDVKEWFMEQVKPL